MSFCYRIGNQIGYCGGDVQAHGDRKCYPVSINVNAAVECYSFLQVSFLGSKKTKSWRYKSRNSLQQWKTRQISAKQSKRYAALNRKTRKMSWRRNHQLTPSRPSQNHHKISSKVNYLHHHPLQWSPVIDRSFTKIAENFKEPTRKKPAPTRPVQPLPLSMRQSTLDHWKRSDWRLDILWRARRCQEEKVKISALDETI